MTTNSNPILIRYIQYNGIAKKLIEATATFFHKDTERYVSHKPISREEIIERLDNKETIYAQRKSASPTENMLQSVEGESTLPPKSTLVKIVRYEHPDTGDIFITTEDVIKQHNKFDHDKLDAVL